MKKLLHSFGKFYSRVIMNFIGIFIFVGILSVVFGEYGWIPNKDIYAISQFVYHSVVPVMIAYASGNQMKRLNESRNLDELHAGGAIAVMATAGIVLASPESGIFGAMLLGPLCGFLWKNILEPFVKKRNTGLEMLVRNLLTACVGSIMAVFAFYFISPVLSMGIHVLMVGMNQLIEHNMVFLLSVIIEPAKVFFLNNSIHHGILLPLGMQQAEQTGESILFLLETNPGPGLGILLALYLQNKKKRKEYTAAMFAEFIGGIHEVYFPEVLSNIWLVLALIAGGTVGNLCFSILNVSTAGLVSPGSILSILVVCTRKGMPGAITGVLLSTGVSAGVAIVIMRRQQRGKKAEIIYKSNNRLEEKQMVENVAIKEEKIQKIGFICDAGVGSSAMGAALFRRKMQEAGIVGVEVQAYAVDQIPEDLTLAVCQKNFKEMLLSEMEIENIYTVESLLNSSEYTQIIEEVRKRGEKRI